MANFLFQITDSARDVFYVRGVGADDEEAKTDAIAKWDAWVAANTPDEMTLEQRTLGPEPDVVCLASDDENFSPAPWPNYME